MTDAAATDVNRTIEYRADRWLVGWLPYALLLGLVGFYIYVYEGGRQRFPGGLLLLIGAGFSLFLVYRLYNPGKSRLTLSPAGLQLHVAARDILIPWREIQRVDVIDVRVRNVGRAAWIQPHITVHDCPVVWVSRPFYDEAVHVGSFFMRGPGWDGVFQPDRDSMRIALYHGQFEVTSQEVRAPIEARWRAFRGRSHPASRAAEDAASSGGEMPAASAPRRSTSASAFGEPIRFGSAVLLSTPWDMIKLGTALVAMLIMGSNALGLWETARQEERRLERQAAAEEARKEKEERDRQKKKWDDFWKDFDRTMQRMNPDYKPR